MFNPAEKEDLNQISLTGIRAIAILAFLSEAPHSLSEIRKKFIDLNILDESSSDDILRIDLNTLRNMGCEISHANAKTDYKYVLIKHPFCFKITKEEISVLKKVYKRIKEEDNIELLIKYDKLFRKIADCTCDNDTKELLVGISALKHLNDDMVSDLLLDAKYGNVVSILYQKSSSKAESVKEIAVQKIVFKNDKFYIYGFDFDKNDSVVLNIKRVIKILGRKLKKEDVETNIFKVKFHLISFGIDSPEPEETIIQSDENGFIVEGAYYNEFLATQRILSLGSKCTVLEPVEFKNKIIKKLREMRAVYGD